MHFCRCIPEVIHVQSAQNLLENVVVHFFRWHIDQNVIDVCSDPLKPLQGLLNAALEARTRISQAEGHTLVLT